MKKYFSLKKKDFKNTLYFQNRFEKFFCSLSALFVVTRNVVQGQESNWVVTKIFLEVYKIFYRSKRERCSFLQNEARWGLFQMFCKALKTSKNGVFWAKNEFFRKKFWSNQKSKTRNAGKVGVAEQDSIVVLSSRAIFRKIGQKRG